MTDRTYVVIDPPTRTAFENQLLAAVKAGQFLLTAQLVPDELSARRNEHDEIREFHFRIYEIHPDPQDFFVTVQDVDTNIWSILLVGDDIRFSVVS